MLNTMNFYCQPILPLVYDESMSYYETLCKVVGQLNTTGETVNKLNAGLTNEISDRQAGDAALDARIKQIEEANRKFHFLKVDTLGHLLTTDVTREKLSQWVQNGDLIAMLYAPDELENSWAVATNYRCMGATGAGTMQLSFYVPISITNNAGKSGSDIAQEVVVISLPVGELINQWAVRHITSTIPNTNADGFVNLTASVSDAGAVTCDVEPGAIVEALRNYFSGTNQFAVAVNARLNYDGKQYHSGAATVKADTSGTGNIRIAFENYYDGVRAENGVRQTVNTTIFLVGDVKTNAWSVEMIDHKTFDFSRYEGFQFTRGAHDVITTDDESTPNAVYAQYHSDTSGKLYQNLPTRLIDSVDGAEYWNGTFDIYGGSHMTFTFVTSNYATASDKMLVRVIELSADVGTTAWKYGVKEFELPFVGYDLIAVTSTKVTDLGYDASEGAYKFAVTFDASFDSILANLAANKPMKFNITLPDSATGLSVSFNTGYVSVLGNDMYEFTGTHAGAPIVLSIGGLGSASVYLYADYLPSPNPDDSDDGKVLTVNKHKWELKDQNSKPLYITIDVANIDERIYTLTDGNKTYTVEEIYAAKENGTPVFIAPADIGSYFQILDFSFYKTAFKAFFLNVVRRTDVSYGRLTISTIGGQTKGTYNAVGFLAASSSANNGKFLKMKQDGSGIEYVDGSIGDSVLYTPQTLTDEQKKQARENVDAASDFVINAIANLDLTLTLDKTWAQINEAVKAAKTPVLVMPYGNYDSVRLQLLDILTDGTGMVFSNAGATSTSNRTMAVTARVRSNGINSYRVDYLLGTGLDGVLPQISMASAPASDMQIATKKYVDDNKGSATVVEYTEQTLTDPQKLQARKNIDAAGTDSPQFKGYVTLTPASETEGIGVGLVPSIDGNNFALDISDVNENTPTKLTGVKTPTDADTNAATTVEYVKNKVKNKVWIDVETEEVKTFNYADIDNEITNGGGNVWLSLGTKQLRMVACNKSGASSYELTFVNLSGADFNIHTVTVSASAAEYAVITK
jgi:hypothetical protein